MQSLLRRNPFRTSISTPTSDQSQQAAFMTSAINPPTTNALTVVELFQSQGCSSCPPANANVIKLTSDPTALVLTYEVTYWDYLGWRDTFGDKNWDVRQRNYAKGLGHNNVFTPQVIVNGVADGVGNTQRDLDGILEKGRTRAVRGATVEIKDGRAVVSGQEQGRGGVVILVFYEEAPVDVRIQRGENGGRTIPHRNVVRLMQRLGDWEGGVKEFELPQEKKGLRIAVLVQAGEGGPLIGAASV